MKISLIALCLVLPLTVFCADPVGLWKGEIAVSPAFSLEIQVKLKQADDESWSGTIDIPVQAVKDLALGKVAVAGDSIKFVLPGIPGNPAFDGVINAAGDEISGAFTQSGQNLTFKLERTETEFTLNRPQTPKPPFPYQSVDVTFKNEGADITLAGSLVIPDGKGPFPAVVFITGSGPQDRDETLMGHKPFLVIADHLARKGIASLRYDDRGFGESGGNHMKSTVQDFAADASAAIDFIAARPEVKNDAIGIVGHSEGGVTGPIVATQNDLVNFLVLLAPPGIPLDQLLIQQSQDMLRLTGTGPDLLEKLKKWQTEDLALVADESIATPELKKKLRAKNAERRKLLSEEDYTKLGGGNKAVDEANLKMVTTNWMRSLLRIDPADYLAKVKHPTLALLGEKDIQVAPDPNAGAIEKILTDAGNPDFEVKTLPGLNHLFQHCETGAISEYGTIEETFAPEALELVSDWINQRYQ